MFTFSAGQGKCGALMYGPAGLEDEFHSYEYVSLLINFNQNDKGIKIVYWWRFMRELSRASSISRL